MALITDLYVKYNILDCDKKAVNIALEKDVLAEDKIKLVINEYKNLFANQLVLDVEKVAKHTYNRICKNEIDPDIYKQIYINEFENQAYMHICYLSKTLLQITKGKDFSINDALKEDEQLLKNIDNFRNKSKILMGESSLFYYNNEFKKHIYSNTNDVIMALSNNKLYFSMFEEEETNQVM